VKLTKFAVEHHQFTIIVFLMLAALGLASFFTIPRSEDPTFPVPIYPVIAVYPGASPSDVEQLVVDPIEDRVREIEGLKSIKTTIEDGLAFIQVEFESNVDAEKKYDELLRELNGLRADLPKDLYALEVQKANPANVNISQVALISETAPYRVLGDYAERLHDRLRAVPGVKDAETWGFPEREVRVSLDLGRLSELKVPPAQVLAAIGSETANIPGGSVESGGRRFNVKTSGSYTSLDEVKNTVVGAANGGVVLVRDVANVQWGYADETHIGRLNGHRAVFVTAQQKEGQNVQKTAAVVHAVLDSFAKTLPPSIAIDKGFDQAANVSDRLGRLGEDFVIAILLVLLTLLPLGIRAAFVVMVSIPLSLAIGMALLNASGFGMNQLTIVGFVIALGLLVDDSIVVIENIERFLREGYSRREAAILATKQITVAVLGCTATLVFAFVPLLSLPGGPGDFIRSMPAAVVYTVLASLLVSLTITPFLASRMLSERENPEGNVFLRGMHKVIKATYAPVLHRALAHPWITLAGALAMFIGSVMLIPTVGLSLFPKAGTPQFHVTVETPEGSSLAETDRAVRFAESVLRERPEVKTIFANVGHGNPRVYYNISSKGEKPNVGELFVLIDKYDPHKTPAMIDSLRDRLAVYPNAKIQAKEFENGPLVDAPIAVRLLGDNLDTLRRLAGHLEGMLTGTEGTMFVGNPLRVARTDLRVVIDRQKAGLLGVPTAEIDRTVRLALAGVEAGAIREGDGDEHAVTVRLPTPDAGARGGGRQAFEALDAVYVAGVTGNQVPLRQVASLTFEGSPPVIQHYNAERSVTVTSYVKTGYNTDKVTRQVIDSLSRMTFPSGYRFKMAGEIESREESFGGLGSAVIITIFGMLAILILEFRTFKSTLIVAAVIPLGVVGGILALFLSGNSLSFMAIVGFVALMGIEIKNSILLVDFTNQMRAEGAGLDEAIQQSGEVRFLPIVLTTMTAIGGLLPLALQGSGLYSPLAWVIIGGLISSTLLARLVTPVMYKLLAPEVEVKASASPETGEAAVPVYTPVMGEPERAGAT
jgi:multidrug efflux pump subunit AcrB